MALDTEAVRLFVRAAETLNISAAGRELGLAPAVASARLAKLENALGADLLHRSTRKVALSVQGAEFLPYAREILAQEDAAMSALGRGQAVLTGTLRFAASSTFAQAFVVPILPEFLATHSELTLDLRLTDNPQDLIAGSFDLALRNTALEDTSLKGRKLADDERVLVAAPSYLEAHGVPERPEDLTEHALIGFQGTAARLLHGPERGEALFDPGAGRCPLIVDDGASQRIATVAGAGISANSLWNVHAELADGRLVRVLPEWEVADRSVLWLVYPKATVLSAKVRALIDFLIARIGKAPPWRLAT